jgi:hypothetical protein
MTEPEKPLNDEDRAPPVEPPDAPRPDWLVGADEGVAAEQGRQSSAGTPLPFKLSSAADRAVDPEVMGAADELQRPLAPVAPAAGSPPGTVPPNPIPAAPPKKVAWTAAASSVPTIKTPAAPTAPAAAPRADEAAGSPPPPRVAPKARPAAVEPPERTPLPDFDPPAEGEEPLAASPAPAHPVPARPRFQPPPLEEPWWVIALESLRSNRTLQLGILGALVVTIGCWLFWPHDEPGVSLRNLRRDPARWDGHIVRVEGRVGEVFPMGEGYAFNLHQGRDTIVVFTRTHKPETQQSITVVGSVTTGFLDGTARQAIFEN